MSPTIRRPSPGGAWRTVVSVVLLAVGVLTVPTAMVAGQAHRLLHDEQAYTDTIAPVLDDAPVRAALVTTVSDAIVDLVVAPLPGGDDVADLLASLMPDSWDLDTSLTPLGDRLTNVIAEQVATVVGSRAFGTLWRRAVSASHGQFVAMFLGTGEGLLGIDGDRIVVELAGPIRAASAALPLIGNSLADRVPERIGFTLAQSPAIATARPVVGHLDRWAPTLPWLAVGALLIGIAVAPDRWRSARWLAVATALMLAAAWFGLDLARSIYLDRMEAGLLTTEAADAIVDRALAGLRTLLRSALVITAAAAGSLWIFRPGRGSVPGPP